jgi:hypothetical protein
VPLTAKMVVSEILVCGVKAGIKQIPIVGEMAVNVVEGLQKRHEALGNAAKLAEFESQLSRAERNMRDTVEKEIRTILSNLGRPGVPGPSLTREMNELRQIFEQGWVPNLFEGVLRNSTYLEELRRNPSAFGRILRNDEKVDPANGMHLLVYDDATRILELPAASLALLLANQSTGIPIAEMRSAKDVWAFPSSSPASFKLIGTTPPSRKRIINPTIPDTVSWLVGEWKGITQHGFIRAIKLNANQRCGLTLSVNRGNGPFHTLGGHWKFGENRLFLEFQPQTSPNNWHTQGGEWCIQIISRSNTVLKVRCETTMILSRGGYGHSNAFVAEEEELVRVS